MTGAVGGIGSYFATEGAHVMIAEVNGTGAEEIAVAIRASGDQVRAFGADISDRASRAV